MVGLAYVVERCDGFWLSLDGFLYSVFGKLCLRAYEAYGNERDSWFYGVFGFVCGVADWSGLF